jgi:antitoxin component of MazEF toxin-antitoxin module
MAEVMIKKIYLGGGKRKSFVVVLPAGWIKMHNLDEKRQVKMTIEPNKIIIEPV